MNCLNWRTIAASSLVALALILGKDGACRGEALESSQPEGDLSATVREMWESERFQRMFAQSYLSETDVEPAVTPNERDRMQKVMELIASEKMSEATEALSRELERDEDASAVFDFTLGNIFFQMEEFDKAIDSYRIAVEKFPKFRRAWKNRGLIHARRNEFQEALPCLTKVVELGGGDALTYGLLGFAYSSLENHLSAETSYRMAILMDAKTVDWKLGLARSLFKQERYSEAISLTDLLIAEEPERPDYWLLQANAYLGLGQPVKAAEVYELVDHLGGSTTESLNMLGDIYINEELYDLAVASYSRAIESNPLVSPDRALRSAKILVARGALDQTRNLIHTIKKDLGEELEVEEKKDLLKIEARLAVADGSAEQEVHVLEEIVELDPLDGEALILLGQHSGRTGDFEKAVFYYERAANIEGFEADAKVRQAQLLVKNGKYEEALPLLRRAQTIKPRENVQEYLEQVERVAKSN